MQERIRQYGFQPAKEAHLDTDGLHSLIYKITRDHGNFEKIDGVLAKVLYCTGKNTPLSVAFDDRKSLLEFLNNTLLPGLKKLDTYFGEYIPPYYLYVGEEEKRDSAGDLDIPVILYVYKINQIPITRANQASFDSEMVSFFKKCLIFLEEQKKAGIKRGDLLIPDFKIDNFMYGSHMGDEKNKLYFVDQVPPFIKASYMNNYLKNFKDSLSLKDVIRQIQDSYVGCPEK